METSADHRHLAHPRGGMSSVATCIPTSYMANQMWPINLLVCVVTQVKSRTYTVNYKVYNIRTRYECTSKLYYNCSSMVCTERKYQRIVSLIKNESVKRKDQRRSNTVLVLIKNDVHMRSARVPQAVSVL